MAEVFMQFAEKLQAAGGALYAARACGRQAPDGGWEGWIEFVPDDGSPVLRSQRETRQPSVAAPPRSERGHGRVGQGGTSEVRDCGRRP